jgi:hypothetical protein
MKCVVEYAPVSYSELEESLIDLVADLRGREIDILRVSSNVANMAIDTPHVHITFVNDIQKLKGRVFDEVFGWVPFPVHLKYPEKPRFSGSLFEYVLDQEGVEL